MCVTTKKEEKTMNETAIRKINAEMQKDPENTFLEVIGHYLIDRSLDPAVAAAVAAETKTLDGAVKAVMDRARKAAHGNAAVMSHADVFGVVDNYFGIATDTRAQEKAILSVAGPAPVAVAAPSKLAALDFDSFMG